MLTLTTLASGSSGNCLLLSCGDVHLLVDAGISCRRICTGLKALGVEPEALSGVLITHEHTDHIAGLATLTKRYAIPVYASPGTGRQLCYRIAALEDVLHTCRPCTSFSVDGLDVETFPLSHDAAEPMGLAVSDGGRKAAVATDLGVVTPEVEAAMAGAGLVVVEANHDVDWLEQGPYPYPLKQRILGDRGHLSNEAGARLACRAAEAGAHTILLAHLSHENNTPQRARTAAEICLRGSGIRPGADVVLEVAPRSEPGRTCPVGETVLC